MTYTVCPMKYAHGFVILRCGPVWHDDVIKWKHFPRYWPFVRGIHGSPVNSPHKGQWRGALMFTLIWARIYGWVNNCEAGDKFETQSRPLWRHRNNVFAHIYQGCFTDIRVIIPSDNVVTLKNMSKIVSPSNLVRSRSREIGCYIWLSKRSEIWQTSLQRCCRCASNIRAIRIV